jgi:hypothetical protein
MTVMAPRESWTDERLDDLKEHMDKGFDEVKWEIRSTRTELKEEMAELRRGLERLSDRLDRLNYVLIAALIGLLASNYLS